MIASALRRDAASLRTDRPGRPRAHVGLRTWTFEPPVLLYTADMDVGDVAADAVAWRRHLHARPELSLREHESARFVQQTLESFGGLEIERPTPTSVVARLRTGRPGPTLALRAELDALPIRSRTTIRGSRSKRMWCRLGSRR